MNNRQKTKRCFTLIEMLVVIAIVAILATLVVGIASRIETREKEKRCRSALALLTTALAQFHEYGFVYKGNFTEFKFPLDCNDFSTVGVEATVGNVLGVAAENVHVIGNHDPNYSGDEVMYLLLSMVPTSRETLGKIDKKLVTNLGRDGQPMKITIRTGVDTKEYPLFRIIDLWGTMLRYDYYNEWGNQNEREKSRRTFPVITSAGPDKLFGTDDDITNR